MFLSRFAILVALVGLVGCIDTSTIPMPAPYEAKVCGSDAECPEHQRCWFRGVDTRAVCQPGANESVAPYPQNW